MIEKIKQILGETRVYVSGDKDLDERAILSAIGEGKMSEEKIEAHIINFVKKGKITEERLIEIAEQSVKVENRKLHEFSSLDELNTFMKNNKTGKSWVKYATDDTESCWCVYEY